MKSKHNREPLVSIVCVTYNHKDYIQEAIEGFLMQKTNFSTEIIIHDDASTDGTTDIIKSYEREYPSTIKPIYQKENQWAKGKRITPIAMSYAQGKYIALCEGDDYWTDPLKLQKQVDFLEKNPDYSLCFHNAEVVDSNKRFLKFFNEEPPETTTNIENIINKWYISTASMLFRKHKVEILPKWFQEVKVGDYPLQLILTANGEKIRYFSEVMSAYRQQSAGLSNSLHIIKETYLIEIFLKFNKYTSYRYKELISMRLAKLYLNLALRKKTENEAYFKYLLKSYRYQILKSPKDIYSTILVIVPKTVKKILKRLRILKLLEYQAML